MVWESYELKHRSFTDIVFKIHQITNFIEMEDVFKEAFILYRLNMNIILNLQNFIVPVFQCPFLNLDVRWHFFVGM